MKTKITINGKPVEIELTKDLPQIKDEVAIELGYKSNSVFSAHEQLLINPNGVNYKVISNSIDQIAIRYAQSKTQELQEWNAELMEMLRHVVYEYEQGESSYRTIREINELLTKHNHLNKKQ